MNKLIFWVFLFAVVNVYSEVNASLPEYPACGVHTGDRTSDIIEFPWTAHIIYTKTNNKKGIHCRGALISKNFVLTSAHCVAKLPKSFKLSHVKLGGINSTNDVAISQSIVNDNYDPKSRNQPNDIALLKLENDVEFNDKIQPICLPINAANRNVDLASKILEISEFSSPEAVNRVEATEVHFNDCKIYFRSHNIDILESQMCAGAENARDSCRGNGGGALMNYGTFANSKTSHYMLFGVSSFGPKLCGTKAEPDVYTRVSDFMDWIVSKTN